MSLEYNIRYRFEGGVHPDLAAKGFIQEGQIHHVSVDPMDAFIMPDVGGLSGPSAFGQSASPAAKGHPEGAV